MGIPSVVVTVQGFAEVARETAKAAGIAGLRVAEYPGALGMHLGEVEENIKNTLIGQIIDGLTKPLSKGELTGTYSGSHLEEIVFSGTLEQINEHFKEQGWSDGLPIVPPAINKIETFLNYTDRSPDEQIAILPQANCSF